MNQPPVNNPYGRPGQPGQPAQYGQPVQHGYPAQQNQYGRPGPQSQYGHGQTSQAGDGQQSHGRPDQPGQYGRVGTGQPGNGAAAGPQPSSAPHDYQPSRLGPIPVEQDRLVLRPTATTASRIQLLVGGGFGLVCLAGAVWNLIHLGGKGTIGAFVILLLLGLFVMLGVLSLLSVRTVLDATGIHVGASGRSRDISWPRSRTGLFVKVSGAPAALSAAAGKPQIRHAEAHVVDTDGTAIALTGLSWSGLSGEALERKGTVELDRIWDWAVARGYTQETGEYVELGGVLGIQQGARARQERRQGLSRP